MTPCSFIRASLGSKVVASFQFLLFAALFLSSSILLCGASEASPCTGRDPISHDSFGSWNEEPNPIEIYTLRNSRGLQARILNLGGIIQSVCVPDRDGRIDDVVLGFDRAQPYFTNGPHFGSLIGRYANRIANGTFTLDGKRYELSKNDGQNTLHGGFKGFDKLLWTAKPSNSQHQVALSLTCFSGDGDEGFPGSLGVHVTYTLTDEDELIIDYEAKTDKATVVNLTSHSYFNLAGQGKGDVLNHQLTIAADRFTPVDKNMIPTGELRPVQGTPFDFTKPALIGSRIHDNEEQLLFANGYDHNFEIDGRVSKLRFAARLYEPSSGRILEMWTTEPGIQFYSGNWLDGTLVGKEGRLYGKHSGLALESEHFPDSPNHPAFPSTVLRPRQTYRSRTVYKFSTDRN
jgi:aldose 1-epimerase